MWFQKLIILVFCVVCQLDAAIARKPIAVFNRAAARNCIRKCINKSYTGYRVQSFQRSFAVNHRYLLNKLPCHQQCSKREVSIKLPSTRDRISAWLF